MLPDLETQDKKAPRKLVHENVSLTLFCADIIAIAMALFFAKQTQLLVKNFFNDGFYDQPVINYIYFQDLFFILLCPFALFVFFTNGHYTQRVPWWSQVQHVLNTCAAAFVFDGFTRFAMDMSVSRLMISLSWIYLFLFILLMRQVAYLFLSRNSPIWKIPTVAIGDIDTITNILFAFHTDRYIGYDVKTVILRDQKNRDFDLGFLPVKYADIHVEREGVEYDKYIKSNLDKFFIVSLETFRGQDRDMIIDILTEAGALYAIVPPSSRMNSYEMEPRYFFGYDLMLMHARNPIFSPLGRIMKRAMDVFISGLALLVLLPVTIGVALGLKLGGQGGSIFYGGHRIGKNGQRFKCWKFRSMEPNSDHLLYELLESDPQAKADWEQYRKLKQSDPRITTRTARFIRKTSIDELPQLWNVLVGDMSLVGPRPILEEEAELFGGNINHYLKVRPGITGLWQVSGRNDTSFQRRVYWDSWYVRNWSLWGDIVILIKTLGVVFSRSGAF